MKKDSGWRVIKHWLRSSGAEFWLPLPFVAIAFWFGSNLLMAQELRQPQPTETKLQADTQVEATVSINILLINAIVNRQQGVTQVEVETTDPILKRLELELPMTDTNQIEGAIAQELQLSRQDVRQLVRYEIVE
jgi:DMSO/TMAO reductase YedYZ molybdopterin-dependent catalytic subunit